MFKNRLDDRNFQRPLSRGYTAVELLMAIGIFAIGITGVAAMQKVTSSSNAHAKNLAIATSLAQSWQDTLAVDALEWTRQFDVANTTWLGAVSSNNNTWILPAQQPNFGPGFGARGSFVDISTNQEDVVFCTHVRLTRLITTGNSGLIRTEVRVFWPKEGQAWNGGNDYCVPAVDPAVVGAAREDFHFVYNTTAVRQTPN